MRKLSSLLQAFTTFGLANVAWANLNEGAGIYINGGEVAIAASSWSTDPQQDVFYTPKIGATLLQSSGGPASGWWGESPNVAYLPSDGQADAFIVGICNPGTYYVESLHHYWNVSLSSWTQYAWNGTTLETDDCEDDYEVAL